MTVHLRTWHAELWTGPEARAHGALSALWLQRPQRAAVSWQTIGTISEDGFIRGGASGWSTVRELVKLAEPYRFVRFTQTGTNSNGSNFLLGSEVVFGGSIFPGG